MRTEAECWRAVATVQYSYTIRIERSHPKSQALWGGITIRARAHAPIGCYFEPMCKLRDPVSHSGRGHEGGLINAKCRDPGRGVCSFESQCRYI